jgi:RNA polymerase sigma-70 factor (ECF subfamily)
MDKQTFAAQVTDMERSLYRGARGYLTDGADCADAVQEALLKAWAKRDTLRQPQYFRTWLTRILINECKSTLRGHRRVQPADPADLPQPPPAEERPPLADALAARSPRDRAPLVLYYLEGYSVRDLAPLLRLPQGTVKCRLHRARKKLKTVFEEEGNGDDEN